MIEDHLKLAASASEEEANRHKQEADRLINESKRLRDEAEQLEQQSKRVRVQESESRRLQQSLEFEAFCLALRRNDASISAVNKTETFPSGYAPSLGHALLGNTHVSSLNLPLGRLIRSTDAHEKISASEAEAQTGSLVEFIGTSEALRQVSISNMSLEDVNDKLSALFVEACLKNRNIEELIFKLSSFPFQVFRNPSTGFPSNVKQLAIDFCMADFAQDLTQDERDTIQMAFQSMSFLTSLTIGSCDRRLLQSILSGLNGRSNGCNLRELKLELADSDTPAQGFWGTLSSILGSTTQLVHLLFNFFCFATADMTQLCRVMTRQTNGSSLTWLGKLTLQDCCLGDTAIDALIAFMRTRTDGATSSLLRELALDGESFCNHSASALASMFCKQRNRGVNQVDGVVPTWYPTIGSQIRSLTVDQGFVGFFKCLARKAHRVGITALTVLATNEEEDLVALSKCIAKVTSLHTLSIARVNDRENRVLRSIRENGNLTSVSFSKNAVERLARAYGERNHFLGDLLQKATSSESETNREGRPKERKADMLLCPSLLEAATQIPSTRASTLLQALLCLHDSIGVA